MWRPSLNALLLHSAGCCACIHAKHGSHHHDKPTMAQHFIGACWLSIPVAHVMLGHRQPPVSLWDIKKKYKMLAASKPVLNSISQPGTCCCICSGMLCRRKVKPCLALHTRPSALRCLSSKAAHHQSDVLRQMPTCCYMTYPPDAHQQCWLDDAVNPAQCNAMP
jgi:hypothetical protein